MKYSELMLLESDVSIYLMEKTIIGDDTEPVEESVSKDVDRMFKYRNAYANAYVFDENERYVEKSNEKVKADKGGYTFAKVMNKLSSVIAGLGTGAALIGKLSEDKTATALGTAVAISGILSRVRFSKKYVEKQGQKYESSLTSLLKELDFLKHDVIRADENRNMSEEDKKANKRKISSKATIKRIEEIQKNINQIRNKLLNENTKIDGFTLKYKDIE